MSLSELLLGEFKQKIASLTLVPSDRGRFEITLDGDLVYSKLETGEFPDPQQIRDTVAKRL